VENEGSYDMQEIMKDNINEANFTKVDLNWRNFKRVNLIVVDFIKAN
jgi:uncharacterized protein YjbI with pentapeptide repeats